MGTARLSGSTTMCSAAAAATVFTMAAVHW
jgi:hypothetical protein